jgi:hypothetical protein
VVLAATVPWVAANDALTLRPVKEAYTLGEPIGIELVAESTPEVTKRIAIFCPCFPFIRFDVAPELPRKRALPYESVLHYMGGTVPLFDPTIPYRQVLYLNRRFKFEKAGEYRVSYEIDAGAFSGSGTQRPPNAKGAFSLLLRDRDERVLETEIADLDTRLTRSFAEKKWNHDLIEALINTDTPAIIPTVERACDGKRNRFIYDYATDVAIALSRFDCRASKRVLNRLLFDMSPGSFGEGADTIEAALWSLDQLGEPLSARDLKRLARHLGAGCQSHLYVVAVYIAKHRMKGGRRVLEYIRDQLADDDLKRSCQRLLDRYGSEKAGNRDEGH